MVSPGEKSEEEKVVERDPARAKTLLAVKKPVDESIYCDPSGMSTGSGTKREITGDTSMDDNRGHAPREKKAACPASDNSDRAKYIMA